MAKPDPAADGNGPVGAPAAPLRDPLFWTRSIPLTARILFVNIFALALFAGSLFYLDSYRNQLLVERFETARSEAEIVSDALVALPDAEARERLIVEIARDQRSRIRTYDPRGRLVADSFDLAEPGYTLGPPDSGNFFKRLPGYLDRATDALLGAQPVPPYRDPQRESASQWNEIAAALATGRTVVFQRYAPDRTPVITAAAPIGFSGEAVLVSANPRDITQSVRDARGTLALIILVALAASIQLALFLARTIVTPLKDLASAASRVRMGREREVVVPRLPERGDEIGQLARAVSDMAEALRNRIDAVESFAADVAHELKNPLASMRSAMESLERVEQPELRTQLLDIIAADVRRIDRLVTEISDLSRIDAEISRTEFEVIDLHALAERIVEARRRPESDSENWLELVASTPGPFTVRGDESQLERVIENLIDNAQSFSPRGAPVSITVARQDRKVQLAVSDRGPGIAEELREKVFERFYTQRPEPDGFGRHSGLGLAIARTIARAHDGTLEVGARLDGENGARFVLRIPAK
ncbi:stimulus-sensing domain-containing protein [Blastomonas marina]|uniref:stimulus-sensing domain-containing protein n=1 Tax=Blastomonas marina TaxID=1867408 RepID=UPI002686DC08|nr:stimulus-sensing domain-containing protein [Blastomonas marina]WPZ04346.1 stimulus-sensing domain-containing protein [Blastomonas marina]